MDSALQYVKGVGPRYAQLFKKLDVHTTQDALFFFPRAYDDRRCLPAIKDVKEGQTVGLIVTLKGMTTKKGSGKKENVHAILHDNSGHMTGVWFNQGYVKDILKVNQRIYVRGKIEYNNYERIKQMWVSEFDIIEPQDNQPIKPIYSLCQGLSQKIARKIIREVIDLYIKKCIEPLPHFLIEKHQLMPLQMAIKTIHRPTKFEPYTRARYRIVFEEFFLYQLSILSKRVHLRHYFKATPLEANQAHLHQFLESIPYSLTTAQKKVIEDIRKDVMNWKPMNRLIQGDVGCGKTDVAVCAILFAIQSQKNAIIMAPTEILAMQHYQKFKRYFEHLNIPILLLKGKMKAKEKRKTLHRMATEKGYVLVGTHAVIQEKVAISDVGLMVIDEQHRFGVNQRIKLIQKGEHAHALYLSATPIPRSFMLTLFGDLDKSIIDESPPGRIPPITYSVSESKIDKVYDHCKDQIEKGHQIYIVYPLVEDSDKVDLKSAQSEIEKLRRTIFKSYRLGLLHGRMTDQDKVDIMNQFRNQEFDIMVSTTVIEVGIDVPNATTIIIQHAERFGLSQLHQLRGRVGRGGTSSTCFLVSDSRTEHTKNRLEIMVKHHDGFIIAEHDLKIRGPGDMMGVRQSGLPDFKLGDIIKDQSIMIAARKAATEILTEDPMLSQDKYSLLRYYLQKNNTIFNETELN